MSDSRPPREPLFNIPAIVVATIVLCALVQVARNVLPGDAALDLIARFAFVPARLTAWFDPTGVAERIAQWSQSNDPDIARTALSARFFLGQASPVGATLVSYAFLHGDWTHLGFNALWLLAFGTPVARRFGAWRFSLFMVATAAAGAVAHWICFPFGTEPVIGASASVSGCMGAALRFVFDSAAPTARGEVRTAPVASLTALLRNRRALSFLVVWFLSNALFGIGSVEVGLTQSPVAWQAHIGGFLAGLFLFPLFDRRAADGIGAPRPGQAPSDRS